MQIQSCRNIRKEITSEDQRYSGYQDEDPSNQQLRNIFFNLDSVENEIRRLNHVLDHFFGKIGNWLFITLLFVIIFVYLQPSICLVISHTRIARGIITWTLVLRASSPRVHPASMNFKNTGSLRWWRQGITFVTISLPITTCLFVITLGVVCISLKLQLRIILGGITTIEHY